MGTFFEYFLGAAHFWAQIFLPSSSGGYHPLSARAIFLGDGWGPSRRLLNLGQFCSIGITYYLYNEIAFLALGRVMQVTRHASSFRRFLEPINFHLRTVPISSRMTKIFEQPNRDLSNRKSRFSLHSTN